MRKLAVLTIAATIAGLGTNAASAQESDNYGGNSRSEQQQMIRLIRAKFPAYVEDTMICIARRESGLNPKAANWRDTRGGSFGLFQINGAHAPGGYATRAWINQMFVPWRNINMAWRIWRGAGLGPWGGGC